MVLNVLKTLGKGQAIVLMACFALLPAFAYAQGSDAENRLRRLENEINTLSRAVYRGETPPPSSFGRSQDAAANAAMEVRLQQLEAEIRDLRGAIETYGFNIRDLRAEMDRRMSDMELRVGDLDGQRVQGNAGPSSLSAAPVNRNSTQAFRAQPPVRLDSAGSASPQVIPPNAPFAVRNNQDIRASGGLSQPAVPPNFSALQPQDQAAASYENAFSLLKAGNFDNAQTAFEGFLGQHPNHALVPNAKYWLGETFYVRREYERAARVFAEGYQAHPDSPKAPDNLLKLGLSLGGMGNNKDACIALQQLRSQFEGDKTPVLRRAEQEVTRLNCTG